MSVGSWGLGSHQTLRLPLYQRDERIEVTMVNRLVPLMGWALQARAGVPRMRVRKRAREGGRRGSGLGGDGTVQQLAFLALQVFFLCSFIPASHALSVLPPAIASRFRTSSPRKMITSARPNLRPLRAETKEAEVGREPVRRRRGRVDTGCN